MAVKNVVRDVVRNIVRPVVTNVNIPSDGNNSYSAEFQTVYDSWTTKPTDADATELNAMVVKMVADGVWAIPDVWYNFAVHTNGANEALVNWINPGTNDATLINAPAFVAFEGFTGAATKAINTNYIPSVDAINYAQDDASIGCYIRTDIEEGNCDMGVIATAHHQIYSHHTTGTKFYIIVNVLAANYGDVASTSSLGLHVATRASNAHQRGYKNKIEVINDAENSTGVGTKSLYVLAYNANSVVAASCNRQISMAFARGNMTTTNVEDMVDAFEAWMDYKGKGVI